MRYCSYHAVAPTIGFGKGIKWGNLGQHQTRDVAGVDRTAHMSGRLPDLGRVRSEGVEWNGGL